MDFVSRRYNEYGKGASTELVKSALEKFERLDMGKSSLAEVQNFANQLVQIDLGHSQIKTLPKVEIQRFGKGCLWTYEKTTAVTLDQYNKILYNQNKINSYLQKKNCATEVVKVIGHELTHMKQREYIKALQEGTLPRSEVKRANQIVDSLFEVTAANEQVFRNVIDDVRRQSVGFDKFLKQFDNLPESEKNSQIFKVYRSFLLQSCAEQEAREDAIVFVNDFFEKSKQVVGLGQAAVLEKKRAKDVFALEEQERGEKGKYHYYQDFVKKLSEYGFKFGFEMIDFDGLIRTVPILTKESSSSATFSFEIDVEGRTENK